MEPIVQKKIPLDPHNMTALKSKENTPYIFLAEDDLDDQELLIEAISSFNQSIEVEIVTNGKKAVSFLERLEPEENPCLIVLDYNLPEMSGAEILAQISHLKKFDDIIKVVWSTSNSPVYEKMCLELGAQAYIVKPNDISGINKLAQLMLQMCGVPPASSS